MKQSQLNLLKRIYNFERSNTEPFSINCSEVSRFDISALERNEYLVQPLHSIGAYHLSLTEKGESFVENGCSPSSPESVSNNFNFSGATFTNSVVGSGISGTNYTFNAGLNFSELKELIDSKPTIDQDQLNELLTVLQSIQQSDHPVNKGILIQFSNLLNKYSDLIVPVGKILIGIFTGCN